MLADMELVFHNCQTYTQGDTGSEYYIKAGRMLEVVRTAFHNAEADNARGQKRKASAGGSAAAAKRPAAASEVSQPKRPTTLAEILAEVKALPPMVVDWFVKNFAAQLIPMYHRQACKFEPGGKFEGMITAPEHARVYAELNRRLAVLKRQA